MGIKVPHPLDILTRGEVYDIHLASLEVLEKAGVVIQSDRILNLLKDAGSEVDYKNLIAKIPEHLVRDMLRKAPSEVTLHARNPKYNARLGDRVCYSTTTGGAVYVTNSTGYRKATKGDVADLNRLADGLENIDLNEGVADPQDVPHEVRDIHTSAIMLKNTEKHIRYVPSTAEGAKALIEMASTVVGGEEELEQRPICSGMGVVSSLTIDERSVLILQEFVNHNLPVFIATESVSGGTTPITLAGTLTQANAEILAGITITELLNPGNPAIYLAFCNIMDMRTAAMAQACPETALMSAAVAQIARYYNLPSATYSGVTNSKVLDEQVGYEKAGDALLPLLAGINMHYAAGNLASALATSYEQLVIDNEILGMLERIIKGINVDREKLGVSVICKVGPGGSYLNQKHTLKHLTSEHWMPPISERRSLEGWRKAGGKDIVQRAREKANEILKTHYPSPLENGVREEIATIVRKYEKEILNKRK